MSLSSSTARNDYTGAGTTSAFAYSFRIVSQTDLFVQVRNSTTGVVTTLTITTDYTVSGVGVGTGGNVTLVNAAQAWLTAGKLSTGYTMMIRRKPPLVQNTDIKNQGTFYPETHEDAFDYAMMVDQKQQDEIDRSVKLPDPILPATFDPTLPANITLYPGSSVVVNSTGNGFTMSSAYFAFYIQATAPTNPAANVLAFWFDQSIDQMKIWCVTGWRIIA
jgi:hypothetical protein